MASMMVSGQWKLALRVAAAGSDRERNAKAQQGIIERCSDVIPEGTASLTVEEVQFYVSLQIEHEMELARLMDDENVEREVETIGKRLVRDESYAEVYRLMNKARQGVSILFDSRAVVRMLGPDQEVPTDPARLYQVADRCRRWLSAADFEIAEEGLEAFDFNPATFAGRLAAPIARLREALAEVQAESRGGVDALGAKRGSLESLRQLVGLSARFYEALYDLAGMEFESDRIRQSSHRSVPAPDSPGGEAPSEPGPPDPGDAAGPPAGGAPPASAGGGAPGNLLGFRPPEEDPPAAGGDGSQPSAG